MLVEVHNEEELNQVRPMLGAAGLERLMLGINNRDLTTFKVDLNTTVRLAGLLGRAGVPIVSESGVKTRRDVEGLAACGVRAMLVGETLMRRGDPGAAVAELLGPVQDGQTD